MRSDRTRRPFWLSALVCAALSAAVESAEADALIPTPKLIIYPGDLIRGEMLADTPADETAPSPQPILQSRAQIVGKVARRTLLPGQAIPVTGVTSPKLVNNGGDVKIVYVEDGLTIIATGLALQDGWLGDVIRIRNPDSGVVVTGKVQTDGTVRVDGE